MSTIQKNFLYNTILSLSQVIFPLITFPYVARILNPEGIGVISFVDSICRYFILFSALGIPIYGIREVAKIKHDKEKLNILFSELILIHFLLTILFLVIYFSIVFFFNKLYENLDFYYIGAFMILSNVFLIEWYFQGVGKFKFLTIRSLVIKIVSTVAIFFLINKKEDSKIYFLIWTIMSSLNALVNFYYSRKTVTLKMNFNYTNIKIHFKPLMYIFSSIAFISIYTLLDTILLGILSNSKSVGLYATALKIAKIPVLFIGSLGSVLIPKLSEYHHIGEKIHFNNMILKSLNFVFTISIPIIFIILGISKELIYMFAGSDFHNSYIILNMLSVLGLLIGISNIFGLQILIPMSKDKYFMFSVAVGTIVSLISNFIFIPLYNEIGAGLSFILAEFSVTIATYIFSRNYFRIQLDYKFICLNILFSISFFFIPKLFFLITPNFWIAIVCTIITSLFYFILYQMFIIKNPLILGLKMIYNEKI